jgi:hypothetical protein
MNCKQVRDNLSPYLDQVLSQEEVNLVEKHLEKCSSCRQELIDLKKTLSLIQGLPELPVPESFQIDLHRKLEALQQEKETKNKKDRLVTFPMRWASLGMAAVLVLVIYTFISPLLPQLKEQSDIPAPGTFQSAENMEIATQNNLTMAEISIPESNNCAAQEDGASDMVQDTAAKEKKLQRRLVPDTDDRKTEKIAGTVPQKTDTGITHGTEEKSVDANEVHEKNGNENHQANDVRLAQADRSQASIAGFGVSSEQDLNQEAEKLISETGVLEYKISNDEYEDIYLRISELSEEIADEPGRLIIAVTKDRLPAVLSALKPLEESVKESVVEDVYEYTLIKIIIKEKVN